MSGSSPVSLFSAYLCCWCGNSCVRLVGGGCLAICDLWDLELCGQLDALTPCDVNSGNTQYDSHRRDGVAVRAVKEIVQCKWAYCNWIGAETVHAELTQLYTSNIYFISTNRTQWICRYHETGRKEVWLSLRACVHVVYSSSLFNAYTVTNPIESPAVIYSERISITFKVLFGTFFFGCVDASLYSENNASALQCLHQLLVAFGWRSATRKNKYLQWTDLLKTFQQWSSPE
jgi:hypothetical protein